MVKRAGGVMPLREAAIVVALVNHPALIDENFEHAEFLELSHPELRQLHATMLDAMAHDAANDRGDGARPCRGGRIAGRLGARGRR